MIHFFYIRTFLLVDGRGEGENEGDVMLSKKIVITILFNENTFLR